MEQWGLESVWVNEPFPAMIAAVVKLRFGGCALDEEERNLRVSTSASFSLAIYATI